MNAFRVFYPAWLDLRDIPVLVVGGGKVALRRVADLIAAGARVKIVSPQLNSQFQEMSLGSNPAWIPRRFQEEDLEGIRLVFASTDDPEVNERVVESARAKGIWAASGTRPARATLLPGATLRRGPLGISLTTSGESPSFAAELRDLLADLFSTEWEDVLEESARDREESLRNPQDRSDFLDLQRERVRKKFIESLRSSLQRLERHDDL